MLTLDGKIAGDVTGYYVPQIEAYINYDGSIYSRTARILSVTHNDTGSYTVTADRNVEQCAVQVTPVEGAIATGDGYSGNSIRVLIYAADGTTPVDADFNLSAHC